MEERGRVKVRGVSFNSSKRQKSDSATTSSVKVQKMADEIQSGTEEKNSRLYRPEKRRHR